MTPFPLPGGKYAAFVWPAYLVSVAGFAWMILDTVLKARRWKRRAQAQERARDERLG